MLFLSFADIFPSKAQKRIGNATQRQKMRITAECVTQLQKRCNAKNALNALFALKRILKGVNMHFECHINTFYALIRLYKLRRYYMFRM